MTLDITVDVKSATPPYEQIRSQIAVYVQSGLLGEGARLPTIRALAADLGVATGTVARAYSELEAGGLIASRRRTGTVVTGGRPVQPAAEEGLRRTAEQLAVQARAAGVDGEAVLSIVRAALLTMDGERQRGT
jgi:GntR family transcriptional regulator